MGYASCFTEEEKGGHPQSCCNGVLTHPLLMKGAPMENSTKTLEERVGIASGQIAALTVVMQFILSSHPEQERLAAEIREAIEQVLANTLATPLSDAVHVGIETIRDQLLGRPDQGR